MRITIRNKYELFVNSYGLSEEQVQAMADEIGGEILDTMLNESDPAVERLIEIFNGIMDKIEEKQYNFYVADQIVMQLLQQIDMEYSSPELLDEEIEKLETVYLGRSLNEFIKEEAVN